MGVGQDRDAAVVPSGPRQCVGLADRPPNKQHADGKTREAGADSLDSFFLVPGYDPDAGKRSLRFPLDQAHRREALDRTYPIDRATHPWILVVNLGNNQKALQPGLGQEGGFREVSGCTDPRHRCARCLLRCHERVNRAICDVIDSENFGL